MTFQQLLMMTTKGDSLRSEAIGWTGEDGSLALSQRAHVGTVHSWNHRKNGSYCYATVRHAMAAGWFVMAPPEELDDGTWSWWLQRPVTVEECACIKGDPDVILCRPVDCPVHGSEAHQ